jgi:hypothetical protein
MGPITGPGALHKRQTFLPLTGLEEMHVYPTHTQISERFITRDTQSPENIT